MEANDTIIWTNESDNYTNRTFQNQADPYDNSETDLFIKELNEYFNKFGFAPKTVLHIGCSAGFSFRYYQNYFKEAKLFGIDLGDETIRIASKKFIGSEIDFTIGHAHDLPYPDQSMDLVFLPMVLQWIPRSLLLKVLAETDRVSKKYKVIKEFLPFYPSWSHSHHNKKVKIFKMDYAKLIEAVPWWRSISKEVYNVTEGTDFQRTVSILKKIPFLNAYQEREAVTEKDIGNNWKSL